MNTLVPKHIKNYNYIVAFFLYATLIVDVYRKMIGVSVETVRNLVYILSLVLILWDAIRTNRIVHMAMIFIVMSLLYFFSSMVYPNHGPVYFSAWMLFVSRLWPAYYIGRYTDDWQGVSRCVRKFIWIALIYALVALTSGLFEASGENSTYATIAANLFYITWISFYDSFQSRRLVSIVICLVCFVPVLFLGTRASMFGALLAIMLFWGRKISRGSAQKKALSYAFLIIGSIIVIVSWGAFSDYLFDMFPNSRTLTYLRNGELFDDSGRSESFYSKMIGVLDDNPLKMYGLVGNQIFQAGENTSMNAILSSFAHNVYLELCMNFGVVIGMLLSVYFTIVLFKALLKSKWRDMDIEFVYLGIFGMTFIEMLISYSWLFQYEIWLLFGMAYSITRSRKKSVVDNNNHYNLV